MATPYAHCRVTIITFIISEEELIKKKGPLDPLEDDDDIKWKIRHGITGRVQRDTRRVDVQDYLQRIATTAVAT